MYRKKNLAYLFKQKGKKTSVFPSKCENFLYVVCHESQYDISLAKVI